MSDAIPTDNVIRDTINYGEPTFVPNVNWYEEMVDAQPGTLVCRMIGSNAVRDCEMITFLCDGDVINHFFKHDWEIDPEFAELLDETIALFRFKVVAYIDTHTH